MPEITAIFWIITTAMGESTSGHLGHTSLTLAGVAAVGGFILPMRLQLRGRRHQLQATLT